MRALPLLLLLIGCAGSSGSGALGGAQRPDPGDSGGSATRPALRAPADTLLCIGANLTNSQVLAWLISNGYLLEGEPWDKLFHEPPMTGPRAGVDTTRYVAFFREIAMNTVAAWDSSLDSRVPFSEWPADSQEAFVRREWRCGLFNLCGSDPCVCGAARWSFATQED